MGYVQAGAFITSRQEPRSVQETIFEHQEHCSNFVTTVNETEDRDEEHCHQVASKATEYGAYFSTTYTVSKTGKELAEQECS